VPSCHWLTKSTPFLCRHDKDTAHIESICTALVNAGIRLHHVCYFPLFEGSQRRPFVAHHEAVLKSRQRLSLDPTTGNAQCLFIQFLTRLHRHWLSLYNHSDTGLIGRVFSLKHTLPPRRPGQGDLRDCLLLSIPRKHFTLSITIQERLAALTLCIFAIEHANESLTQQVHTCFQSFQPIYVARSHFTQYVYP